VELQPMDPDKLSPLRRGLLEFLVLAIVSSGAVYVADILRRLSTTDFATQEGTLYPLLSKMRRENLLDYEWRESASGPPRKYYRLTATGASQLGEFRQYWTSLTNLIDELGNADAQSD
jgi:PadR family transcriptional regulator PadR